MQGSLWGLAILVVTIAAVHIRDQAILVFVVSPQWAVYFPPHSLVAFAYVSGVVLLFGGTHLYRAGLCPIILIWFVNPIPHIFNVYVDLPLQRVSAHVARTFAIALGQPLSHDQLNLMFTPNFGMFIAPGCNGIRGAVTMALIAGYVRRFAYTHVAVIAAAILLGYLFNFARLCLLVIYYIVALHITGLKRHGAIADYIIGGCLFLTATILLFTVIHRLSETPGRIKPPALNHASTTLAPPSLHRLRMTAMFLIAIFGCYGHRRQPQRLDRQPERRRHHPHLRRRISCCNRPNGLAIDQRGNIWAANYFADSVSQISSTGTVISRSHTGGGIDHPQGIAIDGAGNIWIANYRGPSLTELAGSASNNPGHALSPAAGWAPDAKMLEAFAIAIDASGDLWLTSFGGDTLTEFVGLATPVKTPLLGPPQTP